MAGQSMLPEVKARRFQNVFVCRKCKKKVRAPIMKILKKEVICPRCGSKNFRPKRAIKK